MPIKVLALDLESTLITNVIHKRARPGLKDFLQFCLDSFEKVIIYSGAGPESVQLALAELGGAGLIPDDFLARTEIFTVEGWYKNLNVIKGYDLEEILIVDDYEDYIQPDQKSQWIPIQPYHRSHDEDRWIESKAHAPDPDDPDSELQRIQKILKERIG